MTVAVQNPSSVDINEAVIAVPNGNYRVQYFDKSMQ